MIPEDAEAGTYLVSVNAYFDENILTDSEDVVLEILSCEEDDDTTIVITDPEDGDDVTTIDPEPVDPENVEEETSTEESESVLSDLFSEKTLLYDILLVLANIALIVIIAGLVYRFFIKRD